MRINALATRDGLLDLLMLFELPMSPDLVLLAKPRSAAEVALAAQLLASRFPRLGLQVIIETPDALAQVEAIAAVRGVSALVFGGKDLSAALSAQRSWDALLYARGRCVAAAAMSGIDLYDEPTSPRDDLAVVREAALRAKTMGFSGKAAVDLRHVALIEEVFPRIGEK